MAPVLEVQPVAFLKSNGAAYLRVACISIAAYDYILTLPAEWRFYRSQRSWWISPGCLLFILLRYLSIVTITLSNVGFFGSFSREACLHYYMAVPVFKATQMIICQVILGLRTYNISRRTPWVLWTLLVLFCALSAGEVFVNVYARIPVQNEHHNCIGANNSDRLATWVFYMLAMFYDVVTMGISTYYLVDSVPVFGRMSGLARLMFYDGIGYFVVLTAANVVNLILYRASDEEVQSSAATLGYVVTWIMSQRILIHLRDAAAQLKSQTLPATITRTEELTNPRDISRIMRTSQLNVTRHKNRLDEEFVIGKNSDSNSPPRDSSSSDPGPGNDYELDVRVKVQHSVTVTYDTGVFQRETYRKSGRGPGTTP
ncbi:hypothetical protein K474DRAFT_1710526 [Panus rudis PR-1116 ss-1]|nr:hypothetical protein K474DRAFT_1710526 [Panus rudis PR-1116 ss-1]